jgi:5-methylcytosine-specific restriction enzyme subunit McrC
VLSFWLSYRVDISSFLFRTRCYTSALSVPEGMLIYCHHDRTAPPTNVSVLNLGTRLSTWMLRLDRSPSRIELELQALAAHIAQRAASAP